MNRKIALVCGVLFGLSVGGVAVGAASKAKTAKKAKAAGKKKPAARRAGAKAAVAKRAAAIATKAPVARKPAKSKDFKPRSKAERIVEKMVKAMGGRSNLLKVHTIQASGTTSLNTPLGARRGKLVTYSRKPNYQRVDMDIAGQQITQSFHPGGGWLRQGSAVLRMPQSMLSVAQAESVRSDLELRYFKDGIKVELVGERKVGKEPCYVVRFTDHQKRSTTYAVSRKTWFPLERSYKGPSPLGGGTVTFMTRQSDFRWVAFPNASFKIRVPFKIVNLINNRSLGSIQLKKVKLNPPNIASSFFLPPNPTE